ncbi:cupin domain-containing protein [Polymorphospora rubra]|uniref:Cupin type-2 domain-containing protein n=1 Tax=Polymorphospora rubra TaxID=338584 RepID=A0A810N284_9ACTN|nr:cupin domain-containing protein [Polymorphospora rubra]BCJ66309.1 hypothetical protein Prubr_33300 [Polymorphospora rubra]
MTGATPGPGPHDPAVRRTRVPNLHRDLMREVTGDHGGTGTIRVHRAFDRAYAPAGVAFVDLVVLPPGTSIGLHRHGDDQETYVILRGAGRMTLDGDTFDVVAGDVVVNRPYGEHGLANSGADDLHLLVFEIAPLGAPAPGPDAA